MDGSDFASAVQTACRPVSGPSREARHTVPRSVTTSGASQRASASLAKLTQRFICERIKATSLGIGFNLAIEQPGLQHLKLLRAKILDRPFNLFQGAHFGNNVQDRPSDKPRFWLTISVRHAAASARLRRGCRISASVHRRCLHTQVRPPFSWSLFEPAQYRQSIGRGVRRQEIRNRPRRTLRPTKELDRPLG